MKPPIALPGGGVYTSAAGQYIQPRAATLDEEGLGIACLPDFLVEEAVAQGRLVPVPETYVRDYRPFSIPWP
ncbi:hypothetical protein [Pseudomonas sp. nanlin1]|uniref:hypothetical protein n=1 Tax=Pseudomonas sp. nanlin1 TaxID=3040605 RepID=UPI00388D4DA5